ncbi:hypothetical protein [Paenibacillus brasilensis]|uniref:Uncharacterized protein n=1 Tax=Paenibacillus brasilensis TaxID=128574 RepID=A0ABU0L2D7_9BACL|nr:hypothetical protein [Paenibacillus brasilensis]MDQ0494786.1 hypothetical protein [Paenibacillus brasilensis]
MEQGTKSLSGIRSIDMTDGVIEVLKKHEERISKEKELAGEMYMDNDLVCCTNIGKPVFQNTLSRLKI